MTTRSDAELLGAYVSKGDDEAFAEIVARHGAFVQRTCLRLLRDEHEAEDACQTVFLVLAKKARDLRVGDLSAWLYRVGHLVAAETVRKRMRRTQREEQYASNDTTREETPMDDEDARQAVLDAVDAELLALSARYREAVLLRFLRGHAWEEAARLAGCSVGTLSSRATRAIERLRTRLAKRGIAVGATALAAALESEAQAAIPETVLSSTMAVVKAYAAKSAATSAVSANVAALTKGVLNMMFWNSVKTAAVAVVATLAVAGGGAIVAQQRDVAQSLKTLGNPESGDVHKTNDWITAARGPKVIVEKTVPFVINTPGRHPLFSDEHGTVFADVYERISNLFYTVSIQDPNGSLTKGPWPLHAGPGWFMYVDAPDLWVFDGDETVQLVRLFSYEQSHGLSDRTVKEFPEIMKTAPGPFLERLASYKSKTHFDPVRLESAPVVVRARVKPCEKGAVGSVGPAMTRFSTLVIGEVIKNTNGQALAAGAEIALAHDLRESLPVGEFTVYLKTETLKLSGKEHVRYNFTGTAAEGSRYPGAGQGTSHHVTGQ